MFEKIEVLDKTKHKNRCFDEVSYQEIARHVGSIPLGFGEVLEMAPFCPIIISGKEEHLEFIAFSGLNQNISIYLEDIPYIPEYVKTYPFLNAVLIDKKGKRKDVIGIVQSEFVGKENQHSIFEKGELTPLAQEKIDAIRQLNTKRDISKRIVKELQKYDLLEKRDFKVGYEEEIKVVLDQFYIVNREKLFQLPVDILVLWAKKGWITLIDIHLKSLNNFQKVIFSSSKK
jgi:putative transposase